MDLTTQHETIKEFTEQRHEVMKGKGEDYANKADVLANFRHVANANGRTHANVILDEAHKKVLRLQNLMQVGKSPNNESILDSVLDLANYTDLLHCALFEIENDKFVDKLQSKLKDNHSEIAKEIVDILVRQKIIAGKFNYPTIGWLTVNPYEDTYTRIQTKKVRLIHDGSNLVDTYGSYDDLVEVFNALKHEEGTG